MAPQQLRVEKMTATSASMWLQNTLNTVSVDSSSVNEIATILLPRRPYPRKKLYLCSRYSLHTGQILSCWAHEINFSHEKFLEKFCSNKLEFVHKNLVQLL